MLEQQCASVEKLVHCELPPPVQPEWCEIHDPEDVPENAYFFFDENMPDTRHIKVCEDETHVRHIVCYEGGSTEEVTRCPLRNGEPTTCENGLCDGEVINSCVDTDRENDEYLKGRVSYRHYQPEGDICDSTTYELLYQADCRPAESIRCRDDFNCQYHIQMPHFCNGFCDEGECVRPSDYDIETVNDEFNPEFVWYTCEDGDGGVNIFEESRASVVAHYVRREEDLFDNNADILNEEIRTRWDRCNWEGDQDVAMCIDQASVQEASCTADGTLVSQRVPCPAGTVCADGICAPEEEVECFDSDGGDNTQWFGFVDRFDDWFVDHCRGACYEYFCRGDNACYRRWRVPDGNVENRDPDNMHQQTEDRREQGEVGLPENIPFYAPCIDYDLGNYPLWGSYVESFEDGIMSDHCINENTLGEMVCEDGNVREVRVNCAEVGGMTCNNDPDAVGHYCNSQEICDNDRDDDDDDLWDCEDEECIGTEACCNNGYLDDEEEGIDCGEICGGVECIMCEDHNDCENGRLCLWWRGQCVLIGDGSWGERCRSHRDCEEGLVCLPGQNECQHIGDGGPGENCLTDDDCDDRFVCHPRHNECERLGNGDEFDLCFEEGDCNEGLFCDLEWFECWEA